MEFNNRDYKSFPKPAIKFFKYHRHYGVSVDVFSQSFEDMDVRVACQEPDWAERQISAEAQNQTEGRYDLQNTKTKYGSGQRTPVVLPEMEELLPPLSAEQFSALEGDILENGCYCHICSATHRGR